MCSTTLGLERTLARIAETTEAALAKLPSAQGSKPTLTLDQAREKKAFVGLTMGMAGVDRPTDVQRLAPALGELFGLTYTDGTRFIVGNDAMLLSLPMLEDDNSFGLALIAGMRSPSPFFSAAGAMC